MEERLERALRDYMRELRPVPKAFGFASPGYVPNSQSSNPLKKCEEYVHGGTWQGLVVAPAQED